VAVSAGPDEQPFDSTDTRPSETRSSTVTKHWGSAVRQIRWITQSDGAQVAKG